MNRLLNADNPVMKTLSKIFDMGFLSIIYLVMCVPIITIGPATCALYYTSIKVLRRERGYVWSEFFSCFKANFKTGALLGIFFTVIFAVMAANIYVVKMGNFYGSNGDYFVGVYIGICVIVACIYTYAFPILSRFDMKFFRILRFSIFAAFRHLLMTLCVIVIVVAGVVIVWYGFLYSFPLVLIFIPGLIGYLITFPIERVMKKYMPKEEPQYSEDGEEIVAWYNE